ncbi:hypothetical protein V5S96_03455 [Corynebacterium mastitidis]|uniref:Secreted protein n=1 Tax=Corynebacterium mastitidis TaxID=161890 RepID=A0ABU8NXD3_9CORY
MTTRVVRMVAPSVALVLLLGAVLLLGTWASERDREGLPLNGDAVGIEAGESYTDYQRRAQGTLDGAPADQEAYALVVFRDWAAPEQAGPWLEPLARVDAGLIDAVRIRPLPEPVAGSTRSEVLATGIERELAATPGVQPRLSGAIVRDTGERLRAWAAEHGDNLGAVEVLPPDAPWEGFGIRLTLPEAAASDAEAVEATEVVEPGADAA